MYCLRWDIWSFWANGQKEVLSTAGLEKDRMRFTWSYWTFWKVVTLKMFTNSISKTNTELIYSVTAWMKRDDLPARPHGDHMGEAELFGFVKGPNRLSICSLRRRNYGAWLIGSHRSRREGVTQTPNNKVPHAWVHPTQLSPFTISVKRAETMGWIFLLNLHEDKR